MGALNPLFLLAGAAVAVPLLLHLLQRQEGRRVAFPALRYLERTEREHARRIRLRQILLLALRMTAVLAVVGAGAGLFLGGRGSSHPPTALALVLDNSLSSGLVEGDRRVLDRLKDQALATLAQATEGDRIWVILAGEPWLPSTPGGPGEARRAVEAARASAGAGDLSQALARAAELVSAAGLEAREIHLLSDLQATAFDPRTRAPAGNVPVAVWAPERVVPSNRALTALLVGGGLGPLEGQRSEVAVTAAPLQGPADTAAMTVRVVVGDRVTATAELPPGMSVALPLPPAAPGWTLGHAEADPDALSADDRRHFAFRARPVPRVALAGDAGIFLGEAVAVLEAGDRLRAAAPDVADLVISISGESLEAVAPSGAVLVVPPEEAALLPALNRRLQASGIPWRFEAMQGGGEAEAALEAPGIPEPLQGARVRRWYRLALATDPPFPTRTLAMAAGDPWAVEGTDPTGRRYLLVASPMDAASTSLPLSSAMLRSLDWAAVTWAAAGSGPSERMAGMPLSAPRDADAVRLPSGAEIPLDGTRMLRATGAAGIYTFLAGDSVVAHQAVNPPPAESDLTPLALGKLGEAVGPGAVAATDQRHWERAVFRARRGPNLAGALAAAALVLLLLETGLAASGSWKAGAPRPAGGARVAP